MLINNRKLSSDWAMLRVQLAELPSGFDDITSGPTPINHLNAEAAALSVRGQQSLARFSDGGAHEELERSMEDFMAAYKLSRDADDDIGQAYDLLCYGMACDKGQVARQAVPFLEKSLAIAQRKGATDIAYRAASTLYAGYVDQLDEYDRAGPRDGKSVSELRAKMMHARTVAADTQYYDMNEIIDGSALRVEQGEVGFSAAAPIGTDNLHDCVCLIVHDPVSRKTALAHIDDNTDAASLRIIMDRMPESGLQARIIGGRFKFGPAAIQSQRNIRKVTEFLNASNIQLLSSQVLQGEQPAAVTVNPLDFTVRDVAPGMRNPNRLLTAGKIMVAEYKEQLRIGFDLTATPERAPETLSYEEIKELRKNYFFLREEQIFKRTNMAGTTHEILALNDSYKSALQQLTTAVDMTARKLRDSGVEIAQKDIDSCHMVFNFRPLYIGHDANLFNQPVVDYITQKLFVPAPDKTCRLDYSGLTELQPPGQPFLTALLTGPAPSAPKFNKGAQPHG